MDEKQGGDAREQDGNRADPMINRGVINVRLEQQRSYKRNG